MGGRIRGNCVVVTQSMAATGPWHRIIASIYCYCYDMVASHLDGVVGGVGVGGVGGGGGVNVYGRPWSWSMVHGASLSAASFAAHLKFGSAELLGSAERRAEHEKMLGLAD